MKISNETKVGALTAIAITLLVLGFNFLKGKSFIKSGNFVYTKFNETKGLMITNPVTVNGFMVGSVYEITNDNKDLTSYVVGIKLNGEYNIPQNSLASIADNPLGTPKVEIALGNSKNFIVSGDFIKSENPLGLVASLKNQLSPISDNLKSTLSTLDSTLKNVNSIFDPSAKHNLQSAIANVNKITQMLAVSSTSLKDMLDKQNGSLATSLQNMNSFSKNLANQNETINTTLLNVKTTTGNLAKMDLDGTLNKLKLTIDNMNGLVAKLSSNNGSLGLLMNDKALYNNLTNTVRSANILVDDLRKNPKRYVSLSVFGKKEKGDYLKAPLDSTIR
jgi:phospholipid/cholesterol/gamma-HCH transport system substrate-binding protein